MRSVRPETLNPAAGTGADAHPAEDDGASKPPVRTKSSYRDYHEALPGYKYSFPRDHGAHRDFKIEWWYYTGHLFAADGHPYAFELTFFRYGSARERARRQFETTLTEDASTDMTDVGRVDTDYHAVHLAVSDVKANKFIYQERFNVSGGDMAWLSTTKLAAFQDGWTITLNGDQHKIKAYDRARDIGVDLVIEPSKPIVFHGKDGVTQLADCKGCASHYYSYTRMKTKGKVRIGGRNIPVTGTSYMEHQFGSHMFGSKEVGWNWYLAQLSDNREVMIYMMRQANGQFDHNSGGTVINPDGSYYHLNMSDFKVTTVGHWKSPHSEAVYPSAWIIDIPKLDLHFRLESSLPDQELMVTGITYWEGKCGLVRIARGGKTLVKDKIAPGLKAGANAQAPADDAAANPDAEQSVTLKRAGELSVVTQRHPLNIVLRRGDLYIPPYSGLVVRQNADGSTLIYNFGHVALFTEVTANGTPKSWLIPKSTQLTASSKRGLPPPQPEVTRACIGPLIETSGGISVWKLDGSKALDVMIKTHSKQPNSVKRLEELRRLLSAAK